MPKKILDAYCGSKMFWFDKENQDVLFCDIRAEQHVLCDGRKLDIAPDVVTDFRSMPFANESFKMVVFDPPHLERAGKNGWQFKKYGRLEPGWRNDLRAGFSECMRVLKAGGILIFKWNETQIKTSEILKLVDVKPLFGHISGKRVNTHWVTFMKEEVQ